jgi:hypothetical protein
LSNKRVQELQWRRDKVREYSIKGYTQRDIATELQVSLGLIEKDLAYLRLKAKENISKYIDEYLPAEYENCLNGLNNILTEAWNMSLDGDKRERMQALSLAKECYAMKLDLLSSATVIDRAIKFVDYHKNKGRGLVSQSSEVLIYDTEQPLENP